MNRRNRGDDRGAIAAAAAAAPVSAPATTRWRGVALGAEAEITLRGEGGEAALRHALETLRRVEAEFSLYHSDSAILRLNREGAIHPSSTFRALVQLCDRLHAGTGGLFDPTVQALWTALSTGGDVMAAEALVDWKRVQHGAALRLAPGQSLTFNGVAQGFAADLVSAALAEAGFVETLVNIGEFLAGAGDWRIGVAAPDGALLDVISLSGDAVATSSPAATLVGGRSHILGRAGRRPRWSTVSVKAPSAALADGLSTALCLADDDEMTRIAAQFPETEIITASVDECLNDQKYIVPGLGDAGDRLFNTLRS